MNEALRLWRAMAFFHEVERLVEQEVHQGEVPAWMQRQCSTNHGGGGEWKRLPHLKRRVHYLEKEPCNHWLQHGIPLMYPNQFHSKSLHSDDTNTLSLLPKECAKGNKH